MYDQSVSSTTNSPPAQRPTTGHIQRLTSGNSGEVLPQGCGSGMPQDPPPPSQAQQQADFSWYSLSPTGNPPHQQQYQPGALIQQQQQQGPSQTHLQLNLPGPLPSLQAPTSGQGSFWGARSNPLPQSQDIPSTSTSPSKGTDSYRQILHPDEINSDDETDSSFHSGPSSTTPDTSEPPKKKKGIRILLCLFVSIHSGIHKYLLSNSISNDEKSRWTLGEIERCWNI